VLETQWECRLVGTWVFERDHRWANNSVGWTAAGRAGSMAAVMAVLSERKLAGPLAGATAGMSAGSMGIRQAATLAAAMAVSKEREMAV